MIKCQHNNKAEGTKGCSMNYDLRGVWEDRSINMAESTSQVAEAPPWLFNAHYIEYWTDAHKYTPKDTSQFGLEVEAHHLAQQAVVVGHVGGELKEGIVYGFKTDAT